MKVSTEKKLMDFKIDLCLPQGEKEGVGGIGRVGLTDANCWSWNGFTKILGKDLILDAYIATQQWEEKVVYMYV